MNPYQYPGFLIMPFSPLDNRPPTLYSLMNSFANYEVEDKTKIPELASKTHSSIFNFTYPLSSKINKDEFETIILNHFLMRRIGYETFTSWQIALNVKINEIMPMYNKLFDALVGWDIFNDGSMVERTQNNTRKVNNENDITNNSTSIADLRSSNTPQNELEDIKNGAYVTDYNYNTMTDNSTSTGSSSMDDTNNLVETIKRTPHEKTEIYKTFIENRNSIYTMIFNDLDTLFYQLF